MIRLKKSASDFLLWLKNSSCNSAFTELSEVSFEWLRLRVRGIFPHFPHNKFQKFPPSVRFLLPICYLVEKDLERNLTPICHDQNLEGLMGKWRKVSNEKKSQPNFPSYWKSSVFCENYANSNFHNLISVLHLEQHSPHPAWWLSGGGKAEKV